MDTFNRAYIRIFPAMPNVTYFMEDRHPGLWNFRRETREPDFEGDGLWNFPQPPRTVRPDRPGIFAPVQRLVMEFLPTEQLRATRLYQALTDPVVMVLSFMLVLMCIVATLTAMLPKIPHPRGDFLLSPSYMENLTRTLSTSFNSTVELNSTIQLNSTVESYAPGLYAIPPAKVPTSWETKAITAGTMSTNPEVAEAKDSMALNEHDNSTYHDEHDQDRLYQKYLSPTGQHNRVMYAKLVQEEMLACFRNITDELADEDPTVEVGLRVVLESCILTLQSVNRTWYEDELLDKETPRGLMKRTAAAANDPYSVDHCVWNRPLSPLLGRLCSKDVCEWVNSGDLSRCYKVNPNETGESPNSHTYLNRTVDDFRPNAPQECGLCLPVPDCGAIDEHCQQEELIQHGIILSFFLLVCGPLLIWTCVSLGKYLYQGGGRARPVAVEGDGVEMDPMEGRVPVLPPAARPE